MFSREFCKIFIKDFFFFHLSNPKHSEVPIEKKIPWKYILFLFALSKRTFEKINTKIYENAYFSFIMGLRNNSRLDKEWNF